MRYEDVERYILDIPKFTNKNSLGHTRLFLDELGIDCGKRKIIHVAGTNGKGTVCAYMANVLKRCNKEAGMFISPHLVRMTERICVNGENITEDEFVESFQRVKDVVDRMTTSGYPHPSYFEFLFLMSMDVFSRRDVEYIILETGLGGRLDATNVFEKPYVTVITSIGLDHTEILGDTISKIAYEKAGIIKKGVPVVFADISPEATEVIVNKAEESGCKYISVKTEDYKILKKSNNDIDFCPLCGYYLKGVFTVPFITEYQVQNAMLALTALSCMEDIRDMKEEICEGIRTVRWHGRMEQVMPGVYFDGAHNGPGIEQFVQTVKNYRCSGRKLILFSVVKEKDHEYMVQQIRDVIKPDKVYITEVKGERSLGVEVLEREFTNIDKYVSRDIEDTFKRAISEKGQEDVLFCVGSLYLIGDLLKYTNC